VNTNSSETERLANAVVGITATMAEIINEKLKAASSNPATVMIGQVSNAWPAEYPNR